MDDLRKQLEEMTREELAVLKWRLEWQAKARPKQLPPGWAGSANGDTTDWASWGIMSGRGFGKTLTGANWMGLEAASAPVRTRSTTSP